MSEAIVGAVPGRGGGLSRTGLALVYAAFFGSGFSAIVYQVAWQRLLGLVSGSDTVSGTLVVTAFLAGLGLGALLSGALADRLSRRAALAAFAVFNLAIAAFALCTEIIFYDLIFGRLHFVSARPAVFGVAFASMLVPTILMGASLPLLSRAIVQRIEAASREIGRLYAVDLFGAAAGAALTAWVLLAELGIIGAVLFGAAVSALVALGAAAALPALSKAEDAAPQPAPPDGYRRRLLAKWGALFFISGFVAIALEIVWLRLFAVMYQSSTVTFGHVLAVFLLFDALGLILATRLLHRLHRPETAFYAALAGVCVLSVAAIAALYWAIDASSAGEILAQPAETARTPFVTLSLLALLPLGLIAVPAMLIGFSFPIVQLAVQRDLRHVARAVGVVYVMNILGNTLGGALTGLVLLEFLGTAPTLALVLAAGMVFGVLALSAARGAGPLRLPAAGIGAGAVALFVSLPDNASLWARLTGADDANPVLRRYAVDTRVVEENASGVSVIYGNRKLARVSIGGRTQGDIPFWPIHRTLGMIGPLLHPEPETALIIGFGSGGTPYMAGLRAETRRIEVVEIVDSLYAAHRRFSAATGISPIGSLFDDPRFHFISDDGRRYLARSEARFDVIEIDAIIPSAALSGMLYSIEFFELLRDRLAPGGVVVQWRATPRVEHTLKAVFAYGLRFDDILIGSDSPEALDATAIRARLADRRLRHYIARAGVSADDHARLANPGNWRGWTRVPASTVSPQRINTDLHPRDELQSIRRMW